MLVERASQTLAVAQLDDAPAAAAEDLVEPLEHAVGTRRVEALAIVIDDPPEIAHIVLGAFDERLVDVAFVELGVADQRDKAAAVFLFELTVGGEVILRSRLANKVIATPRPTEPVEKSTGILSLVRLG